jgi:hypothetical protein
LVNRVTSVKPTRVRHFNKQFRHEHIHAPPAKKKSTSS